jgi:hypothetical protein
LINTALTQFAFNTNNALTTQDACAHEACRKASIGLQPLLSQRV